MPPSLPPPIYRRVTHGSGQQSAAEAEVGVVQVRDGVGDDTGPLRAEDVDEPRAIDVGDETAQFGSEFVGSLEVAPVLTCGPRFVPSTYHS